MKNIIFKIYDQPGFGDKLYHIQALLSFKLQTLGYKSCNLILYRYGHDNGLIDQFSAILPYLDPALNINDIYYFCIGKKLWYKMNFSKGFFQKIDGPNLQNIQMLFNDISIDIQKQKKDKIPGDLLNYEYFEEKIKKYQIIDVILFKPAARINIDNYFIRPTIIQRKMFLAEWPIRAPNAVAQRWIYHVNWSQRGSAQFIKDYLVRERDLTTDFAKHQISQEINFKNFIDTVIPWCKENQYTHHVAPYERSENMKCLVENAATSTVICAAEGGWFNFAMHFNVPLIMVIPAAFRVLAKDELEAVVFRIFSKFRNGKKRVSFVVSESLGDNEFYNKLDDEIADLVYHTRGKKIVTQNTDDRSCEMLDNIEKVYRQLFAFV